MIKLLNNLGAKFIDFIILSGAITRLTIDFFRGLFTKGVNISLVMRQIYFVGVKSLPLATIVGLFIGMVITIQFAYGLKSYGALDKVPKLVALAMVRELGPGFIALLVGGKIGSGFAAEIGSMKVGEQIDAMRSLGDDPVRRLISPRIIAVVIILPLLTIWADIVSFIGGAFVTSIEYNLDPAIFLKVAKNSLKNREIIHSIIKSMIFGYLVAIIGTTNGFRTGYGTESVGKSTTSTVQTTFVFILITNFFLSKYFMVVKLTWLDTLW